MITNKLRKHIETDKQAVRQTDKQVKRKRDRMVERRIEKHRAGVFCGRLPCMDSGCPSCAAVHFRNSAYVGPARWNVAILGSCCSNVSSLCPFRQESVLLDSCFIG